MAKVLVNFADGNFQLAQQRNTSTAMEIGGCDRVVAFTPKDIGRLFCWKNRKIFRHARGAGYWLWKPYFIARTLDRLCEGDYLIYSDAGAEFIRAIDPLIEICDETGQDVIVFDLVHIEKRWTKRDAFILMECDAPDFTDSRQRLASLIICKRSRFSRDFMHEFLNYAQDERLLTDMENQLGYPNYEGFHEHRHDQSILSLLSKKYGLMAFRDPSQFGNQMIHLHPESHYGQLMIATRARNPPPKTLRERFKATVLGRILRRAKRSVEALTRPGKPGE